MEVELSPTQMKSMNRYLSLKKKPSWEGPWGIEVKNRARIKLGKRQ